MKFSSREDINAPIEHVWQQVTDFASFERQAMRRGADVRRVEGGAYAEGAAWDVAFSYRGKDRKMKAVLTELSAPTQIRLETVASGINGLTSLELVPLSPQRTRLAVSIELSAKSLSARLLLQSLKLAKANLTNRFKKRVSEYASEIENRHR